MIARALFFCFIIAMGGYMSQTAKPSSETRNERGSGISDDQSFVKGLWGVRYQVKNVKRSVDFYHSAAWPKVRYAELTSICTGVDRQSEADSQWPRCVGFPPDAGWQTARAGWMESNNSAS